jgi:hypothetical protein
MKEGNSSNLTRAAHGGSRPELWKLERTPATAATVAQPANSSLLMGALRVRLAARYGVI